MSQLGGTPTGREDDWWGQLYDESAQDTGPAAGGDSLDDRFASASNTVGQESRSGHAAEDALAAPGRGRRDDGTRREPPPASPPTAGPPRTAAEPPPRGRAQAPDGTAGADGGDDTDDAHDTDDVDDPGAASASGPGADSGSGSWFGADTRPFPPGRDDTGSPPSLSPPPPPDGRRPPAPARPPSGAPWGPAPEPVAAAPAAPSAPPPPPPPSHAPAGPPPPRDVTVAPALAASPPVAVDHVGSGPPTYDAEPTALPAADPDALDDLVPDTVLDGARYGACTLRAASVRGDSARYRGEPRRDALLTARFGTGDRALVLVAMATGARATPGAHHAAAEACRWIARAVGRSQSRLAEDIRAARRGDLKAGLHRLTDRSLGRLRSEAADRGVEPDEYAATLRCLLLSADPGCRTRVFFGVGEGGLFRLRDGVWQDIEPRASEGEGGAVAGFGGSPAGSPGPAGPADPSGSSASSGPAETPEGDRLTMDLGIPTPPSPYEPASETVREPFRFRVSVARPGDALLMCTGGLAEPLRGEPALAEHLAAHWSGPGPPGLAAFLADAQTRVKGYADDRTAAAVWEA